MTLQCTKSAGHWRVGSGLGSMCPGRGGRKPAKIPNCSFTGEGYRLHACTQVSDQGVTQLLVLTAESRHTIFLLYLFDQAWLWKEKLKAGSDGTHL